MPNTQAAPLPSVFRRLAWSNLAAQSAEQIVASACAGWRQEYIAPPDK